MADQKITQLTENTSPDLTDLFAMVDDVGGTPSTQKVEVETLADVFASDHMYRNALINSDVQVWQKGTSFATYNDDTYGPDRWNLLTETNGAWTCARDTDVPAALGFKYSAKFTNVTLNNQCALVQILENVDSIKLDDKTVSLSFYAKTSGTEIANLRAAVLSWSSTADSVTSDVVGTWASDGTNPTWATNWTAENTPSNLALTSSWTRHTLTATIDTASMANIAVVIWVDDGTIAANDDFWITGVQLCAGSVALPYMPRSYVQEERDCKRYCHVISSATASRVGHGYAATTTQAEILIPLPVTMRAVPTLTATAADYQLHAGGDAAIDVTGISLVANNSSAYCAYLEPTVASGLSVYRPYFMAFDAGGTRLLILSSEL